MTGSDATGEPAEPGAGQPDVQLRATHGGTVGLLALVVRALGNAPTDADDATLFDLIGPALIGPAARPALGELAALLTTDRTGAVTLAGVAASDAALGRHLGAALEQRAGAASFAEVVARGGPLLLGNSRSLWPVPGIASEMVAPFGSGGNKGDHDALLVIASTHPARDYEADDQTTLEVLVALLASRRAVRDLTRREATLQQQIDAAAQAGRLLAHRLNNDITMPVGVVELLVDRGTAGPELQEMLEAAAKDLAAIEEHIRAFHEEMRARSGAPAAPQPPPPAPGRPPPW
jgi:hypothetical protein